jgi:isopentenyl phosphate kinase
MPYQMAFLETDKSVVETKFITHAVNMGLVCLTSGGLIGKSGTGWVLVSTEEVFSLLSKYIEIDRIILIGEVPGVFTADPKTYPHAKLHNVINRENIARIQSQLGGSAGIDVTGGMLTKVNLVYDIVANNPTVVAQIASGKVSDTVYKLLIEEYDEVTYTQIQYY